jgi:methionyl-tRNA synthetase
MEKEIVSIEDFKKIEIKIGEIISVETIEGSEKLLKLMVNFGEDAPRQILSGIRKFVSPESLLGVKCSFVTNLPIREMMGLQSQGMIMAGSTTDGKFSLLRAEASIPVGTRVQ